MKLQYPVSCEGINSDTITNKRYTMTKQTKPVVSETPVILPKDGREANPHIMEGKLIDLGSFSIPKLGVEVRDNPRFVQHMFLLGLCKILGDDTAQAKTRKMEAIQESFTAWNAGYQTLAAMEKARRAIIEPAKSGKASKLQYSQLQVCSALRATLGADDSRIAIIEGFNDERFSQFMALKSGESYMVDALTFLRKQDEEKAKKEADKLAAELAALGL